MKYDVGGGSTSSVLGSHMGEEIKVVCGLRCVLCAVCCVLCGACGYVML